MKKVVTLGEIMLRLTTPGFDKIEQARNFAATYGEEKQMLLSPWLNWD